jgi:uncharacterized protein involved in exopolysaccharide biosynthesis
MDLWRFVSLDRSRWWQVIACTLTAAGSALYSSLIQADRYQAGAHVLFGHATSTATPRAAPATSLALASLDTAAARVKVRFSDPVSVAELRHAVGVKQELQSDLVTVTTDWSTPTAAADVANAFADEIVALRRDLARTEVQRTIDAVNRRLAAQGKAGAGRLSPGRATSLRNKASRLEVLKGRQTGDAQVVERATPPGRPTSPRPVRDAILSGGAGLILGLLIAGMLARFDQRTRAEEEWWPPGFDPRPRGQLGDRP